MRTKNKETMKKIEDYINGYSDANGSSPTVREISAHVGISNPMVCHYLADMAEQGMIAYDEHRRVLTRQMQKDLRDLSRTSAPVVGNIICGEPQNSEQFVEDRIRLPASLFGPGPLFILHARGASMTDAGIEEGDLVVVRQQQTAEPGDIVVALTEDGTTLKGYFPEPENERIRLQPANPDMAPMYYGNVVIQGVAVKVIKSVSPMV